MRTRRWRASDGESRFDEFVRGALTEGPQFVVGDDDREAVLISTAQWRSLRGESGITLKEWLLTPEARNGLLAEILAEDD